MKIYEIIKTIDKNIKEYISINNFDLSFGIIVNTYLDKKKNTEYKTIEFLPTLNYNKQCLIPLLYNRKLDYDLYENIMNNKKSIYFRLEELSKEIFVDFNQIYNNKNQYYNYLHSIEKEEQLSEALEIINCGLEEYIGYNVIFNNTQKMIYDLYKDNILNKNKKKEILNFYSFLKSYSLNSIQRDKMALNDLIEDFLDIGIRIPKIDGIESYIRNKL